MWAMRRNDPKDTRRSYFRSGNRIFSLNGQWFFATREGEVGPFRSREVATKEAMRYVRERHDLERFQRARELERGNLRSHTLSIVPKDDEPAPTLDELMLMEHHR